jgi:DNA-binding beta-propeller fold protein YncE
MPYDRPAFTKKRILEFAAWIDAGAPNSNGDIAFEPLTDHELIYVLNAQCNLVTVIDATSGLVIRYVDISEGGGGFAEIVETSADGQHFYVCHNSGELKKFSVSSNLKVGQLDLGPGFWRSMVISDNSQRALLTDWSGNSDLSGGKIALVDLNTMALIAMYDNPADSIYFPGGIAANNNFDVAYASCQTGNFLYKVDFSDELNPVVGRVKLIDSEDYIFSGIPYRPSEIVLAEDQLQYYVVCEVSKKLYVFDAADDAAVATLDLGTTPQKCVISESQNILAVSNMEDVSTMPTGKGFVRLFDLSTFEVVADVYTGYQPRAMTVTADGNTLYIFNRNADLTGADKPHHYSGCAGNNGYATRIDLTTLQLDPGYKAELNVNPFSASSRY